MSFIQKILGISKTNKKRRLSDSIEIYLDPECKKFETVKDQYVHNYYNDNKLDSELFIFLSIKNKKTNEIIFRRKLYHFEKLSQCILSLSDEYTSYLILGYNNCHNSIPKIQLDFNNNKNTMKFIRSGTLQKFIQDKNIFQQCQLKLHHDYLTFYKIKIKEQKVSFMPLENAVVQIQNEKKCIFQIRDRFKTIRFKTTSREDMAGWLMAISDAIKIRNAQIYMNEYEKKLNKTTQDRVQGYIKCCIILRQQPKMMLLDDIARSTLKKYFQNNSIPQIDKEMLQIFQQYLKMCKYHRQNGQQQTDSMLEIIKNMINSLRQQLPSEIKDCKINTKHQFSRTIQTILKYLDSKYKKQFIDRKILSNIFLNYPLLQYQGHTRINMKSILGTVEIQKKNMKNQNKNSQGRKSNKSENQRKSIQYINDKNNSKEITKDKEIKLSKETIQQKKISKKEQDIIQEISMTKQIDNMNQKNMNNTQNKNQEQIISIKTNIQSQNIIFSQTINKNMINKQSY